MKIKQEIFNHLSLNGIYLPENVLNNIANNIKTKNVFTVLNELQNNEDLKKYDKPSLGAFKVDVSDISFIGKNAKREVIAIDEQGNETTFESLYAAGKKLNVSIGNIKKAIKRGGTAYGYKWK